ncbi:exodeoxyribonuclease III [Methylobacillus arboreus]|uniref:exodeoxyribonuclease III n=1 Tax=Methylobacillus arboreus TaxID=755170 RepID=UPI001E39C593|nr:exodeoxyribonuclease III [Methylobacillus arboreus]MCB5190698.1 exodeoxyribonuclease III [Methylobacillus arboreus]
MRIISLNLNGIRSASSKGFYPWMQEQQADIVCLQELKAQEGDMTPEMLQPEGYYGYFHYADKKGYSGVGIYSREKADAVIVGLRIADIDNEGRYLEARYGNLSVVSLYLPSGSSGEERQTFKFSVLARFLPHLESLIRDGRDVVICGDWNIAHQEADLKNWRGNRKNSGFLPEERAWLTDLLGRVGWVDVYRLLHPDTTDACYTWWSNRGQAWAKNVGWRIDYQIATPAFAAKAVSATIYKDERFSDHAPLTVDYQ